MRCRQSARLTPAAAIRINTSPASGSGTGRVAGTSISGPPGALISMTVWVAGMLASTYPSPQNRMSERHLTALIAPTHEFYPLPPKGRRGALVTGADANYTNFIDA